MAGIGRRHHLVVDCADPLALATFYARLLALPVTYESPDFVVVSENETTSGMAFQRVAEHVPPQWPDPRFPQQMHVDVMVDDVALASAEVVKLGARPLSAEGVFADPAGHPFCLVPRPSWARPIN